MKNWMFLGILLITSAGLLAQETVIEESFADEKSDLEWSFYPSFNPERVETVAGKEGPDGKKGIGLLTNQGRFASLSYIAREKVADFYFEAMMYCPVTKGERGPISGLAFLVNPEEQGFYRIAADFGGSAPKLSVAYVGRKSQNYPAYLNKWTAENLPGGIPTESGWHKIAVRVHKGQVTVYWDDQQLPGEKMMADKLQEGYVGVYVNYIGIEKSAETMIDDLVLRLEPEVSGTN